MNLDSWLSVHMVMIDNIDVTQTLKTAKEQLDKETQLSPATKSVFDLLIVIVSLLLNRLGLNSQNSSKPPSADPNREKKKKTKRSDKKPGAQPGRQGKNLEQAPEPDEVVNLTIDRDKLPAGHYENIAIERRQVFDIKIQRWVTEYQAEVLADQYGNRYTADFPDGVSQPVQYDTEIKAHAVYLSQFQLIPYDRIRDYFFDQVGIPISVGSLFNFNKQAYERLDAYEKLARKALINAPVLHADETGINVNGKKIWLHGASTQQWVLYYPHEKRGKEAMDEAGVLLAFKGIGCHDHWKPYYQYSWTHALCNAHHLRELQRAYEQDGQRWAYQMLILLVSMNEATKMHNGALTHEQATPYLMRYKQILDEANEECPEPTRPPGEKKRGRLKRSKSRNLLERLQNYSDDVLKFLTHADVPFTNNQGENDIRMTKVQQKISGCFRSMDGAKIFCRNRGYISSCRKQGKSASDALRAVFSGDPVDFINST